MPFGTWRQSCFAKIRFTRSWCVIWVELPRARARTQRKKNRGPKAAACCVLQVLPYGVSTRTTVGFGNPAIPPYATEPRYFVAAARPVNVRLIGEVRPIVADAGADTDMLPASALPSTHVWSLNGEETLTPQPCTTTVYVSAPRV